MASSSFRPLLATSLWLAGALWVGMTPLSSQAAGTAAGTTIQNTAQVSYSVAGTTTSVSSNSTTLNVAEIINVALVTLTSSVSVTPGSSNQVLQYRVTNTGNAPEKFHLLPNSTLVGDGFDPVLATPNNIYFDTDGTPGYSPGDTPYTPGSNDPTLAADASITVLVLNNIPASLSNGLIGKSELTANAFTGTGAAGTVFAGQGQGGVDAVLGTTGGTALAQGQYVIGAIAINAVKSQVISNDFGSTEPVPGATITYQIVITASGSGTANNVAFMDAIPANTTYVPGSLKLDSTTLTDAADVDAGQFAASPAQVTVSLGSLTAASTAKTIGFAVKIN